MYWLIIVLGKGLFYNIDVYLINIFDLDIFVEWNKDCCIFGYMIFVFVFSEVRCIIVYIFNC